MQGIAMRVIHAADAGLSLPRPRRASWSPRYSLIKHGGRQSSYAAEKGLVSLGFSAGILSRRPGRKRNSQLISPARRFKGWALRAYSVLRPTPGVKYRRAKTGHVMRL